MIKDSGLPLTQACKSLEISRQGFYEWKHREPPTPPEDPAVQAIQAIATEFPRYGYRRIYHALQRQGRVVNPKKIRRIMKEKHPGECLGIIIKTLPRSWETVCMTREKCSASLTA